MSITNVEVKKNQNENSANLLRRFSRKVGEATVLNRAKRKRYNERAKSKLSLKKSALVKIDKRKKYEKLKKMGKLPQ